MAVTTYETVAGHSEDVQGFLLPLLAGAAVVVMLASGCGKDAPADDRFLGDGRYTTASRRG